MRDAQPASAPGKKVSGLKLNTAKGDIGHLLGFKINLGVRYQGPSQAPRPQTPHWRAGLSG